MFGQDQYRDVVMCSVRIRLTNEEILSGVIEKPRTKTLGEFLNGTEQYLDIELYDGDTIQLAKLSILYCRQHDQQSTDQLAVGVMKADIYDPFSVLGLVPGAPREAVRKAYISQARLYHPDRYEGLELPPEMAEYVLAMTKKLNIAFNDANELINATASKRRRRASGTAA